MTKQDEKQRLKRRLEEQAIEFAAKDRWSDAVDVNQQILTLVEDSVAYNRLGKALIELGRYREAHSAYEQAHILNPTSTIARKNISRLEALLARGLDQIEITGNQPLRIDMRLFITEAGKTAITTLMDVQRCEAVESLSPGERVELHPEKRRLAIKDCNDVLIGYIEPKLGQRLNELLSGGNRYIAAVAQCDPRQVQILIREIYQDPSQRGRVSFPSKLNESAIYGYVPGLRYDYEVEELLEEDEVGDDHDDVEEDFTTSSDEDEEIGLDEIEKDISDEDEPDE